MVQIYSENIDGLLVEVSQFLVLEVAKLVGTKRIGCFQQSVAHLIDNMSLFNKCINAGIEHEMNFNLTLIDPPDEMVVCDARARTA
jgi:hypothetical protein